MGSLQPVSGSVEEILGLLRVWDTAAAPPPLVIETSGSTGRPKRVMLSRAAMRASVEATHRRLGGAGQWVLTVPPAYVAGVQVLYRSLRAGTDPVVAGARPDGLPDLDGAHRSASHDRTYLSLVPTQLHRALAAPDQAEALRRFSGVLVGGGPTQPTDLQHARDLGITVVRTYGMSETCGGCVYDGVPLDGVEVRVDHDRVLLRGPVVFDGYEGEPDRTAAAFEGGWLRTHDLGRLDDGVLTVLGREDDVIISGGVKVPAQAVESMLAPLGDAVVFGVPDAEWGERVVAAVDGPVADNPEPDGQESTLQRARELVHPRSWAPKQVVTVDFAWLANGKPDRPEVRRRAEAAL